MSKAKKRPWAIMGMFAIGVLPIALAAVVYFTKIGIPEGRTNHGHLIDPPLNIKTLNAATDKQTRLNTWWVLTIDDGNCRDACQKQIYHVRQINTALGKNQERVQHGVILSNPFDIQLTTFLKDYPNLKQFLVSPEALQQWISNQVPKESINEHFILVADPLGNVMLYYTPDQNPRDVLEDLNKLLKYSTIG